MSYDPSKNLIEGSMTTAELTWLYEAASCMNTVVEVGSWKGRSAHALLNGCKGRVYCVDHFKGSAGESSIETAAEHDIKQEFLANVGQYQNLTLIEKPSVEAAKLFGSKSVDMVFLDACHEKQNVLEDIAAWLPKSRIMLCGHDWGYDLVQEAIAESGLRIDELVKNVVEYFNKKADKIQHYHNDSIWVHYIGGQE